MALILKYATKPQLLSKLRETYRDATGEEALRLAAKIQQMIVSGDLTDAEIRTYFNVSVADIGKLKARLNTAASQYSAVLSVRGE